MGPGFVIDKKSLARQYTGRMRISIIAAMGLNREIGENGRLPWELPDEMKIFRSLTENHAVIMGRGTFETIGHPLKKRKNIVISKTLYPRNGIQLASSLDEALHFVPTDETQIYVIGGEKIYQAALPVAHQLILTTVNAKFPNANKFFPAYELSDWEELEVGRVHPADDNHKYSFETHIFNRRRSKE